MRTLTITNVPDRLLERLAARAAAHRRRLEEEALSVLDEALAVLDETPVADPEALEAAQRERAEAAFVLIDELRESMPPVSAELAAQVEALRAAVLPVPAELVAQLDAIRAATSLVPTELVAQLDALRARSTYQAPPGEIEAMVRELRDGL